VKRVGVTEDWEMYIEILGGIKSIELADELETEGLS
jgi:hypothetical protein